MNINFVIKSKIRKDKVHKLIKAIEETNLFIVKQVSIKRGSCFLFNKVTLLCESDKENFKEILEDERKYFSSILNSLKPKYIFIKCKGETINLSYSFSERLINFLSGFNKEELILWQN